MATLNWIGKDAVVNHDKEVPFKLLEKVPSASVGKESENLILHGDNLEALKALVPFYKSKIKCIYIDPPYNTGNEGWVYNDKVNSPKIKEWLKKVVGREGEDLTRHDKWLCMMYPRLKLLKELLTEDGVIFVSIDDNEHCNLRAAMDEIFQERNFVTTVVWRKNYAPKSSAKYFSEDHEYLIVYAKNKEIYRPNLLPRTEAQDLIYKNPDNDSRGPWRPNNFAARNYYSKGTYSITTPGGRVIDGPPRGLYWRSSKEKLEELDKDGRIWWGKDGNNIPAPKIYLSEVMQGRVPQTFWDYTEAGHTQDAKREILGLLDFDSSDDVFVTPKPTELIKRVIKVSAGKEDIILDSFAGSGTTGHAVLDLNKEDGGNRNFILVEMEDKVAKNITAKRVRNAIKKFSYKDGFEYCELAKPLFNQNGQINEQCTYSELASYIYFTETHSNATKKNIDAPYIGESKGVSYYLLYIGRNRNDLTRATLNKMKIKGTAVVYADRCLVDEDELKAKGITFKQIPYEVKVY